MKINYTYLIKNFTTILAIKIFASAFAEPPPAKSTKVTLTGPNIMGQICNGM